MGKNLINLVYVIIIGFSFTGCVKWQNGILVQDLEDVKKRNKVSVYVDNQATLEAEKYFLNYSKKLFKDGFVSTRTYSKTKKNDFNKNNNNEKIFLSHPGWNKGEKNYDTDIVIIVSDIVLDEYNEIVSTIIGERKKQIIQLEFNLKDRMLVSNKKYADKRDVIIDYIHIASAITNGELGLKLAKETGYQYLILDGNMLKHNKLGLIGLTKRFSYKDEIKRVFESYGYKITEDKTKSDVIIQEEVLAFAQSKNLKNTKRISNLASITSANTSIPQLSMTAASFSGNSSGSSAAIGAALFALNLISSSNRDNKITFNTIVNIFNTETKNFNEISILRPTPVTFFNPMDIYKESKRHMLGKSNGDMGGNVNSLVYYLDYGKMKLKYDRVLKRGINHKVGILEK